MVIYASGSALLLSLSIELRLPDVIDVVSKNGFHVFKLQILCGGIECLQRPGKTGVW